MYDFLNGIRVAATCRRAVYAVKCSKRNMKLKLTTKSSATLKTQLYRPKFLYLAHEYNHKL